MSAAGAPVLNGIPAYVVVGGHVMAKWVDELRYEAVVLKINDVARTACVTWSGWSKSWDCEVAFDDMGPFDDETDELCYLERLDIEVENLEDERVTKDDPSFKTKSSVLLDGQSPKITRRYKKLMMFSTVDLCDPLGTGLMYHIPCLDRNTNLFPHVNREISGLISAVCDMIPELGNNLRQQLVAVPFNLDNCVNEGVERLAILARLYNEAVFAFMQSVSDERLEEIKNADITSKGAWCAAMNAVLRFLPVATRGDPPPQLMCGIDSAQLQLMLDELHPTEDDLFLHLGSGSGELVLFFAAACKIGHSIGFEIGKKAAVAQQAHDQFYKIMNFLSKVASPVSFAQTNYLDTLYADFVIEQVTILFIDNRAMSRALSELIKDIILTKMPHGRRVLTTDLLVENNTDIVINKENFRGLAAILITKQLGVAQGAPPDCPKLYLHSINRIKLDQFLTANPGMALPKAPKRMSLELPKAPEQTNLARRSSEI